MTVVQRLRLILKRHSWAVRELYVNELNTDANYLSGCSITQQLATLQALYGGCGYPYPRYKNPATLVRDRSTLGNKEVVRACRNYLTFIKDFKVLPFKSSDRELMHYLRVYPWVLGELIFDAVHQQAKVHFYKIGVMYVFLKTRYTREQILEDLLWLVHTQHSSRKSLVLELELRGNKKSTIHRQGISTVR